MTASDAPLGIVLAAGAGRRFGGPKALARTPEGEPWLALAVTALHDGGCGGVMAVLGAGAEDARLLLPAGAGAVVAERWADGLAVSLAEGLRAASGASAVVVTLVDLPGLPAEVVRRVLGPDPGPRSLRRAVYDGRPGHPVLIGADHVAPLLATLAGDRGGRDQLERAGVQGVECADLFSGVDQDRRR
ncbi:MAG TPA: NTP transferase domain-containing protein [Amnibacterium sp.]